MSSHRALGAAAACPLLLALSMVPGAVLAGSEESTAERLILPLAIEGRERTSEVTFSNGSNTPIEVKSSWFGAKGSPLEVAAAGEVACNPVPIQPLGAVTLPLADLCPRLRTPDRENLGYIRVSVASDERAWIGASIVTTAQNGARFRIDAEPLGAHDIAAPIVLGLGGIGPEAYRTLRPLEVHGLEGEVATGNGTRQMLTRCWVASPDGAKSVNLSLADEAGKPIGTPVTVNLNDREMEQVDVLDRSGLPAGRFENVAVLIATPAPASSPLAFARDPIVAGCSSVRIASGIVDYRRARSPAPSDATRQPIIYADEQTTSGPYLVGFVVQNSRWQRGQPDTKATVAVFVQPDDKIACRIANLDPAYATQMAYMELQVKDALGTVVAGGEGTRNTGVFETGPRDRVGGALAGPWTIEVSLDEVTFDFDPAGFGTVSGAWGFMCESAAGMSQPVLAVPDGRKPAADDF
jgi:hypothetical protein